MATKDVTISLRIDDQGGVVATINGVTEVLFGEQSLKAPVETKVPDPVSANELVVAVLSKAGAVKSRRYIVFLDDQPIFDSNKIKGDRITAYLNDGGDPARLKVLDTQTGALVDFLKA
jgi:hypothetical protein